MRILVMALALAMGAMLAACEMGQTQKIGVVDLNRLMRESVPGKAGLKFIESQQSELQAKLDEIQGRLEKNPGDDAAVQELQKTYAEAQQRIQSEGQNVVTKLFDAIQKELDSWRVSNGYAVLLRLEAVDSYAPSLDVTNMVMGAIDKLKIEFAPAKPEAREQQPADAPASAPEAK